MAHKPDIILTGPAMPHAMERLARNFTIHLLEDAKKAGHFDELRSQIALLASTGSHTLDQTFFARFPKLKLVSHFGVGVDMIDLQAAMARGISITNTPDVLSDAVAEFALALLLATARNLVQGDAFVRAGRWPTEHFGLQSELTGTKVGILGLGRIGKEIATRCRAFKMDVAYYGRNSQPDQPYSYYADLTAMAHDVDWLISVLPGDTGTEGIISRDILTALGPNGGLINVGRGSAVDETALLDMLTSGQLGAAGLDVFVNEPQMDPGFWDLPNVVLAPHQASATHKTRRAMADLFVDNLIAARDGKPLLTPVR